MALESADIFIIFPRLEFYLFYFAFTKEEAFVNESLLFLS